MNNTYIIPAFELDEVKAACHCARSISRTNPECDVILMTNERYDNINYNIFTTVVDTPFQYHSSNTSQEHWWQVYYATEADNNIMLSPYTIINEDQTDLWEHLTLNYDVCIPHGYYDFRDDVVHRGKPWYNEYDIPFVNTDAIFFKKGTETALLFFKMFDILTQNFTEALSELIDAAKVPEEYDVKLAIPVICKTMPSSIIDNGIWRYNLIETNSTDFIVNYGNVYEVNNYRMTSSLVYDSYKLIHEFIGDAK